MKLPSDINKEDHTVADHNDGTVGLNGVSDNNVGVNAITNGHSVPNEFPDLQMVQSCPHLESGSFFDLVLASPLQTYEQLAGSFSFITAADVMRHPMLVSYVFDEGFQEHVIHSAVESVILPATNVCDVVSSQTSVPPSANIGDSQEESLEELVLCDIDIVEPRSDVSYNVKVDNFVETEDDSVDDLETAAVGSMLGFTVSSYGITDASFICRASRSKVRSAGLVENISIENNVCSKLVQPATANTQSTLSFDELLDFTSQVPSDQNQVACLQQSECTTDIITQFSLDPDFDYDNVRLSAKFSQEEREHLNFIASALNLAASWN